MTISLGGIALNDNLLLTDPSDSPQVAMSVRQTFGVPVVQKMARSAGKTLVLSSLMEGNSVRGGVFTQMQKEQIAAVRDAGNVVTLVHPRGTFTVVIPVDGVQLVPMWKKLSPGPDEAHTGTVTMITV